MKRLLQEKQETLRVSPATHSLTDRMSDPEYAWKYGGANPWSDSHPSHLSFFRTFTKWHITASIILVFFCWFIFRLDHSWAQKGQVFIRDALTREIDFSVMNAWYERTFAGSPSFLPSFISRDHPEAKMTQSFSVENVFKPIDNGRITSTFSTTGKGIRIASVSDSPVFAISEGWITNISYTEMSGYTVMIRHAEQMESIYSGLSDVYFTSNDWVKGGERIGRVGGNEQTGEKEWFFAIRKGRSYLDPLGVIPLD